MSNLITYSLPYLDNYDSLEHLPGFALLESGDKRYGRYDIVTALPYDSVQIKKDTLDIPAALKALQAKLRMRPSSLDLPFQGGAIGYISYDLGAILAGITSPMHPLLSDIPLLDLKFYDWAIISDHQRKTTHLVAANEHPDTPHLILEIMAYWKNTSKQALSFKLLKPFTSLISLSDYRDAFQRIHAEIKRGRTYQVNYTTPYIADYEGSAWAMYKKITSVNPVPFAAFLNIDDGHILSFSPERYLSFDDHQLLASPIKGSTKRSADLIIDKQLKDALLTSAKNRAENVMIVDLWRNDLSRISKPGSVHVSSLCELMSFQSVHHLVSHIESVCDQEIHPLMAFLSCFPAGSITGAPKLESMKIIHEQERYARGVYCGGIGYFSRHGRSEFNIAIRTMIAKEQQLYLGVGGGLVIDSDWVSEYQECNIKMAGILKGLC